MYELLRLRYTCRLGPNAKQNRSRNQAINASYCKCWLLFSTTQERRKPPSPPKRRTESLPS